MAQVHSTLVTTIGGLRCMSRWRLSSMIGAVDAGLFVCPLLDDQASCAE